MKQIQNLANCHVAGLYSIVLAAHDDGAMERMFIDTLGGVRAVAPHSHRYQLELSVNSGELNHIIWTPAVRNGMFQMYSFTWDSPIMGGTGKFVPTGSGLEHYNVAGTYMYKDDMVELEPEHIHSLCTIPGTSWTVFEYPDSYDGAVTLHDKPKYAPNVTGLYVKI